MLHARLQVSHVLGRKSFLIQLGHSRVDFLNRTAEIVHERATFAGEIVDSGFARTADICIRREICLWLSGGHHYIYKPIAQQTRASDREFGALRDLNVIINFQRYSDTTTFANQPRSIGDLPNSRAGEQDIGALQEPARIIEANGESIIGFESLSQPAELHNQSA